MKRILGILMIFSIVLLGCSSTNSNEDYSEIYEVIEKATEKTNQHTSFAATMSMNMKLAAGWEEVPMNARIDFKANSNDPEDENQMEMSMNMYIDVDSEELSMNEDINMYFKDGVMYTEVAGQKIKSSSIQQTQETISQTEVKTFEKDAIESATMKKDGDSTVIDVVLEGDGLADLISDVMKMQQANSEIFSDVSFKVRSMSMTFVIDKDGYIQKVDYNMDFEMSVLGQKARYSGTIEMEYTSFEQQVIEFPDFSEYQEIETDSY